MIIKTRFEQLMRSSIIAERFVYVTSLILKVTRSDFNVCINFHLLDFE